MIIQMPPISPLLGKQCIEYIQQQGVDLWANKQTRIDYLSGFCTPRIDRNPCLITATVCQ